MKKILLKNPLALLFIVACLVAFTCLLSISATGAQNPINCYFSSAVLKDDISGKSFKDFCQDNFNQYHVFTNQKVELEICFNEHLTDAEIKADSGIVFEDGADLGSGVNQGNQIVYKKILTASDAGTYNINVIAKDGTNLHFDSLILVVMDELENLTIVPSDRHITFNQEVEFSFIYNNCKEMIYPSTIGATLTAKDSSVQINSDNYSACPAVQSFTNSSLVLDTSKLEKNYSNFNLNIKVKDIEVELAVSVKDLCEVDNVVLNSNSATFNSKDDFSTYYVYITKNSKPILHIFDESGTIELNDYYKVESDKESFDKLAIVLKVNNVIDFTNVLFEFSNSTGNIYKSLGVCVIDEIQKIELKAKSGVIDYGENVEIVAVVNGKDDYVSNIDWYINDVKKETTGNVYNFSQNGGTYTIYAKIGDVQSGKVICTVKYGLSKMIFWYGVLLLSIIGIVIFMITIKRHGNMSPFGTLYENIEEIIQDVKELKLKYTGKLSRKVFRNLAILKERCYKEWESNEEHLYAQASKALQIAYKSARRLIMKKLNHTQKIEVLDKILEELNVANDALLEFKRVCSKVNG